MIKAVVEIGSTGIRLTVAESAKDGIKVLDRAERPVPLGRDVFADGSISFETQALMISILMRIKEQLLAWGITAEDTTVIATSALREAKMRDTVVDRILVKTGFRTRVIDGIEENRLMYLAVTDTLKGAVTSDGGKRQETEGTLLDEDSIILEVGGGSTEMMLMRQGKMAGAHSLKLGTVRVERQLHSKSLSISDIGRFIEEFIRNTKGSLDSELDLKSVKQFLAVGRDATVVAINVGKPISPFLWRIERASFDKFVSEMQQYSVEELSARFKIPYSEAQTIGVSLLIYKMFIHLTDVSDIIVSETNIRDGIIISELSPSSVASAELEQEFSAQITSSAMSLLHKYRGDEKHAVYVWHTAQRIYDVLSREMSDERDSLLLGVSAILHDIGFFIKADKHNEHSAYIIKNSDIFGLSHHERSLVSLIARYHRGTDMPQDDDRFQSLAAGDRMKILKLSSVLRVADALDRGHSQKLGDLDITLEDDTLVLHSEEKGDALERIAVAEKSDMFMSVFGYKVMLE